MKEAYVYILALFIYYIIRLASIFLIQQMVKSISLARQINARLNEIDKKKKQLRIRYINEFFDKENLLLVSHISMHEFLVRK
jgi:hypothetical protein